MAKLTKKELREVILADESLSEEVKGQLLDLLKTPTFGLVWEEKTEDVVENLRKNLPVLKEDKSKAVISDDPEAPNHILIEGDNLEALTVLGYTHEGKVDVIYIDPPYNTGNKDFVYNDSFVDTEDNYRHSKWLSFMEKRLKLAKKLLSDKGVIFISIDDNEQANLKLLCDEVFGWNRFIANFCRTTGTTTGQDANKIGSSFDYCLMYAKNEEFILNGVPLDEKDIKRFKDKDERGHYSTLQLRKTGNADTKEDRPNMFYDVIAPDGSKVYPFGPTGYLSRWRVAKESYDKLLSENMIVWKYDEKTPYQEKDGYIRSKWTPHVKYYLEGRTKQVSNLIQDIEGNKKASLTLKEIFGDKGVFDNPKPIELLKLIEIISTNKDSIILDFFAGSGTTMHATMQLNAEDEGNRQCILVTNNENHICEEVTYERNKRVINGYTTPKGEKIGGLHNNNLRYYRIEHMPRKHTHANKMLLTQAMTEMLQIKWNAYKEQEMFGTLKAKPKYIRYFTGDEDVLIIYVPEIIPHIVKELQQMPQDQILHVYVAAEGNYAFSEEFTEVTKQIDLAAIPAAYYNAIRDILPEPTEEQSENAPSISDDEILKQADKSDFQD